MLKQPTVEAAPPSPAPLGAVVIYEDAPARKRIQNIYEHVVGNLSDSFQFGSAWYGFDDLADGRQVGEATAAAAKADLVLLSVNDAAQPAPTFRAWVETWLARKKAMDTAMAALVNQTQPGNGSAVAMQSYLRDVAQRAGADFFSQIVTDPDGSAAEMKDSPEQHPLTEPVEETSWSEGSPLSEVWPD